MIKNLLSTLFLFSPVLLLIGCDVPTIGSELAGKPELGEVPYPDINTVPFGEDAFLSRQWHRGPEAIERSRDKQALEEERKRMLEEGEKLRIQAGLPPSQRNP